MKNYRPVVLMVLDGWGIRETSLGNAVIQGNTQNYDHWLRNYERTILDASGEAVGLTEGQMGNSEVGHLNIGSGRVVYQDITRINLAIRDGSFYQNNVLTSSAKRLKEKGSNLHLFGLLGPGGVHSHEDHLFALCKFATDNGITPIVHLITDGRDTPPHSGIEFAQNLITQLENYNGVIASVSGRYYAMDRDNRWDRTKLAYDLYVYRKGDQEKDALSAIQHSYDNNVTDEFIKPVLIENQTEMDLRVKSGDCLLFYNFRADRMRQIVKSFAIREFSGFETNKEITDLDIVTFTEYEKGLPVKVMFPKELITNPLAEILSKRGLKQFHAAETEKYAHVTFFFNGGREEPFEGEERLMVPSPKVATYDLQPEMSADELAEAVIDRINSEKDDFIVVNFANPDMVGHTGILEAAIKAVETVDRCAGKVAKTVLDKDGICLITADHGNSEIMIDLINGGPHTYHSINPVNLFVITNDEYFTLKPRGKLADIAPTILEIMGIAQPEEMTGTSLVRGRNDQS